jgi:hypothetical protein
VRSFLRRILVRDRQPCLVSVTVPGPELFAAEPAAAAGSSEEFFERLQGRNNRARISVVLCSGRYS